MGNVLRFLSLLLAAVGVLATSVPVEAAYDSEEGILVGRIAHVDGKLLRYIEEENDWVVTVKDSPFGLEDALYSGDDAKAEFIMPNRTWLRVGENTQVQLIALNPDTTTVDVAFGLARLYNKSDDTVIKVTTPFGYVVAPGGTVFDLYVGDESLEVIAVRGDVDFVHDGSDARYEIREGSFSIIADKNETARGNGTVDAEWDDWNEERDKLWAKRLRSKSYSEDYLPEPIRDEAYVLDESGRWESVYYEGESREMWRPTHVDRGWRPFTVGRWTVYYGDQCWVPDEPFGYVTHHYGSWVFIKSSRSWYWAPPVTRIGSGVPVSSIGFGWYPGRVGWIHSGPSIGWVPLAPNETYYGYRPWGHRTVIYNKTTAFNNNMVNYRYLDEAVVIDRDHFYRGSRYTPHVQRNVSRDTLINNYRPTRVINNTVINNFNIDKRRYTYNDVEVSRKPHTMVIDRINDNRTMRRDSGRINRDRIEKDLTRFNVMAEPQSKRGLRAPMLANKLVDADKIDRPLNTLSMEKKELKHQNRERQVFDDKDQRRGAKGQDEPGQIRRDDSQEGKQRIRSPRDLQSPETRELSRQQEANQESKGPKFRRQQQEEEKGQRQPVREMQQRQEEESEKRPAQPQSPRFKKGDQQKELQQEQTPAQPGNKESRQRGRKDADQMRDTDNRDDKQRVQPPLEQELDRKQDQARQQQEAQGRQEQESRLRKQKEDQGRQQELQQRKQIEDQGRQQELQQRKQKEDQGRQQELQQRKQKEDQSRQQELQQRKQHEDQGRQEREQQRRQQDENQLRQKQEKQHQQPKEVHKPQEQQQQRLPKKMNKKEEEEAAAAAAANPR